MNFFKILILLLIFTSCSYDNCSDNLDFKLDYHLFESVKVKNNTSCDLINKSLNNEDVEAITSFSKVDVNDFASYQHGAVLIKIIQKISEEKYLKIFKTLSEEQQKRVISYISVGIDFNETSKLSKFKNIDIEFPLIMKEMKSK